MPDLIKGLKGQSLLPDRCKGRPVDRCDQEEGEMAQGGHSEFDYVRFTWADINGVARSKIITAPHVKDKLRSGIGAYSGRSFH